MRAQVWRRLDYPLLLAVGGLTVYGLMMVHSATCSPSCDRLLATSSWALRQALYALIGIGAMALATAIDYRAYRTFAYYGYGLCLMLLAAVLTLGRGDVEYGARRWIPLGFFDFQPSELTKLVLVIVLARFLSDRDGPLSFRRAVISSLFLVPPLVLVYLVRHGGYGGGPANPSGPAGPGRRGGGAGRLADDEGVPAGTHLDVLHNSGQS